MRDRERGSALIIAVLVVAILSLLGISFLMIADTENRIAENERLSSQALYFAEAGARAVVQWFDRPGGSTNLANPPQGAVDRTLREIDDDGDPLTLPHHQNGAAWPRYKQADDRLFDRPYRIDLGNTLLGTEGGPDMRIDGDVAGPARDFLDHLSDALMAGYPAADSGIRARVSRIDIYAPPYLRIGGTWTRYGIATVKVLGRIYRVGQGGDQILAERMVKAVLNEIPYAVPYGSVHSGKGITVSGGFPFHWGAVTSMDAMRLDPDHRQIPASLPRGFPSAARLDLFGANFTDYRNAIAGETIDDPWLRVLAGGALTPAPNGSAQPYPSGGIPVGPPGDGQLPHHAPGIDGDQSNLFQGIELADCPEFDYDLWKSVATSGRGAVGYYVWDPVGVGFKRDGVGATRSFRDITDIDPADPRPALFFFDTKDSRPPYDGDGDGSFDNLTPPLLVEGGTWSPRGFIYINAESLRTSSITGRPATIHAPGEPFQDANQNGRHEPPGEIWVNLHYPASLSGPFIAAPADDLQDVGTTGPPVRNAAGPAVIADVAMDGILYMSGSFDASGTAVHYGSVIARQGVVQSNPSAGAPDVYWDESIALDSWPPPDWSLPRVFVTRWETDM